MPDDANGSERRGCLPFVLRFIAAMLGEDDGRKQGLQGFPFHRKGHLLSKAERSFLGVLDEAAPSDVRVLLKVRVADVLGVNKGEEKWRSHFNRLSAKHFDFVLADRDTLRPLMALELDDKSHDRPDRRTRDSFLDEACKAAGLPLIRVKAAASYRLADVRERLDAEIGGSGPESGAEVRRWRGVHRP